MLRINVVTLFPDWFTAPLSSSILGRAAAAGLVKYRVVQLRDYAHDKHHTVDDAPYGGGAGMVLKIEPMVEAVEDLKVLNGSPVVLLSARGKLFTHDTAVRYSLGKELTLLWRLCVVGWRTRGTQRRGRGRPAAARGAGGSRIGGERFAL